MRFTVKDYKDIYGRNKMHPVRRRNPKTVDVRHKPNRLRKLKQHIKVAKSTNKW